MDVTSRQILEAAFQHHQAGHLREAELGYRQILSRDPSNPDALHLLGLVAFRSGQLDLAIDLIQRAIQLLPEAWELHSNLAEVFIARGSIQDAINAYRK